MQCIAAPLPVMTRLLCVDLPAHHDSSLRWPCHLTTVLLLLRHRFTPVPKDRIINLFPIRYGFHLFLRVPPNPGWTNLPQVPLGFRGEGFSPSSRYSGLHPHLDFVQRPSRVHLRPTVQRSPTNFSVPQFRLLTSAPLHLRRNVPQPVSCYALF